MKKALRTISIVGRPNVGKSTLFNRLIRRNKAIVMDTPGITRDRNYEVARLGYDEVPVMLVDTGGFLRDAPDHLSEAVVKQVEFAIQESDAIILVVDGRAGLLPQDEEIVQFVRPKTDRVILAVNKIDTHKQEALVAEFFSVGLDHIFPISAEHNLGIEDLTNALAETITDLGEPPSVREDVTRCAIVGRPNVGKSSIVNALMGEDRVLVHDEAGTTRDAVDSLVKFEKRGYVIIDTAGIKRRSKTTGLLEKQTMLIAERSIRRSDVTLLVMDANDPATSQDSRIASIVVEQGKGLILIVNKWDLVKKDDRTLGTFVKDIQEKMAFAAFAPMGFVSAVTRQRLVKTFPLIDEVNEACSQRISTGVLNRFMRDEVFAKHKPVKRGKAVKFYFATQSSVRPPTFVLFSNRPSEIDDAYLRYVSGSLREKFGFTGAPIRLLLRKRQ